MKAVEGGKLCQRTRGNTELNRYQKKRKESIGRLPICHAHCNVIYEI